MRASLASVSVLALGLMLGGPALAQQAGAPTVAPAQIERIDRETIKDRLGKAGVEDREEFKGRLVQAQSPEGHPVLMLFGPENMAGDESVDFDRDEIRGRLAAQGFSNITFADDAQMVRGSFGDDKRVLAFAGGLAMIAGVAQADQPDLDRMKSKLGEVGLEDRDEFRGKLIQARIDGQPVFLVIGPEDFAGDESVELSAADLTKFQQEGFEDARVVDDVKIVRGTLDDKAVLALAGSGVRAEPAATGAVGVRQ